MTRVKVGRARTTYSESDDELGIDEPVPEVPAADGGESA